MDMFIGILNQLGANESIWYQLGLIVLMYVLAKFLFIDHLQKILETREEKTVKLVGNTEKQFAEITKIQNDYKEKIRAANKEVKENLDIKKQEIIKKEESEYKAQEKEINKYITDSRAEIEKDIKDKKDKILADAESLSSSLVQKITQG